MSRISSLQDPFLNALRKEKISTSVYLINGIKLQGIIEAFDQFSIVLKDNVNQMVYKHSISTIVPSKMVRSIYNSSIYPKNNTNDGNSIERNILNKDHKKDFLHKDSFGNRDKEEN